MARIDRTLAEANRTLELNSADHAGSKYCEWKRRGGRNDRIDGDIRLLGANSGLRRRHQGLILDAHDFLDASESCLVAKCLCVLERIQRGCIATFTQAIRCAFNTYSRLQVMTRAVWIVHRSIPSPLVFNPLPLLPEVTDWSRC
eukprot:767304-Hanusia_phi.AAC.4